MKLRNLKLLALGVITSLYFNSAWAQSECSTTAECAQRAVEVAASVKAQIDLLLPKGAVMAFALDACPDPYWEEYEPAYGRFIRGIDKQGSTDPDGIRAPGNKQPDQFSSHTHSQQFGMKKGHFNSEGWEEVPHVNQSGKRGVATYSSGDQETRPKNVALLYCVRK